MIRVLGAELYGLVIFAQVIAAYFGIIVDFGFRLTATKEISIHRNDKKKLSEIVSSILSAKFILWILSFLLLLILISFIPSLQSEKTLFLLSFGLCFNEFLFPQWYFQGLERMKYITIINLTARLIFLALIFLLVKQKSDYLFVPLLNTVGTFFGGVLGLYMLFVKDGIKFKFQSLSCIWRYLRKSSPLFGSNAIISVKDRLNIVFIGSFLGMKEVAIYDLAVKIMTLFMQPVDIINTAVYPKISKDHNTQFLLRITRLTFILILIAVLLIQPFLTPIIDFLSEGLIEALLPSRVLLISPLLMVWSFALGRNCLVAFGEFKLFTWGMFMTTLMYIILFGVVYISSLHQHVMSYIIITVSVYLFELLYRFWAVTKLKLL